MNLTDRINSLKKEKNAVILAHYYVPDEVQAVADFVGDSYYLAKVAKTVPQDTIVFCGVEFMGESAKILNPSKRVLMPDLTADCAMAHMATRENIERVRAENEDVAVVCYINSTAELKCCSDVCVTSSNAVKIVKALPNKSIYFIPDVHLARYVASQVPEKHFIFNDGHCPVHTAISADEVAGLKREHPEALVLSHPECDSDILALSDYIGSTSGIIDYASSSDASEFIVCTEIGVGYELRRKNPKKSFYFAASGGCCEDMKKNTLEKLANALESGNGEVFTDSDTRSRALLPLDRMLELAK